MDLLHLAVLALVQGITEFLPISSSAHLILIPQLTGWTDQGLQIDIAVHVGTLLAVALYLRRDVGAMIVGFFRLLGGQRTPSGKLAIEIILATIPVVVAGAALSALGWTAALRSAVVIGWASLGFGIVLHLADRYSATIRRLEHMTLAGAFIIGLSQVLALIPGTSRAGITMTAARMAGYERREAARFSMLLSIPTIIAAGALSGVEMWRAGDTRLEFDALIAGGLSLVSALVAIALMMRWLERSSFTPFVVYRVALGAGLLIWAYA